MDRPLIVGAGPVGLGAALFLARRGIAARIVDMRAEATTQSKALAVNPRTLEMLEATGVTARMLERGRPIRGMQFHRDGRIAAQVTLQGVHPRYPFLLGLSQATTERLLAEALAKLGGHVERQTEMTACRTSAAGVEAELRMGDGSISTVRPEWLLAADGAHSAARRDLNIEFPGSAIATPWHMCDVRLKTSLSPDFGHVEFLADNRLLFLLPVIDDTRNDDPQRLVWRVLGNFENPLTALEEGEPLEAPLWTSSFRVAHKVSARFAQGNVYLAGDAAHIHSPMGARGMNLGLEDAFVFANLAAEGRLDEYHHLRHPVDHRVVKQVRFFTNLVSSDSWLVDQFRRHVFPRMIQTRLSERIKRTVTGLDHPLPQFAAAAAPETCDKDLCGCG